MDLIGAGNHHKHPQKRQLGLEPRWPDLIKPAVEHFMATPLSHLTACVLIQRI